MVWKISVLVFVLLVSSCKCEEEGNNSTNLTTTTMTPAASEKHNRYLTNPLITSSYCSSLQYSIQRTILTHNWNLQKLKFQQRLKLHPLYIVTIQHIRSVHDPLIELRCPGGNNNNNELEDGVNKLEVYFHESRFAAESVRLFDIRSIFPVHTGTMSVRIRLRPLVVVVNSEEKKVKIKEIYWRQEERGQDKTLLLPPSSSTSTKEHRENEDSLLELEREIEGVFIRRIQPDVQKQIEHIVRNATEYFLRESENGIF